jgi:hypothetical protein
LFLGSASAADVDEYFIPGEQWQEQQHKLPAYPKDDDLVEVAIDAAGAPFEFFIDRENLSVGLDEVIRYTLVIRSFSGASNVFHEGLRCDTLDYKTYAFGASDGKFIEASSPTWQHIGRDGTNRYRRHLAKYYMCSLKLPYPKDRILENIIYHPSEGSPDRYEH